MDKSVTICRKLVEKSTRQRRRQPLQFCLFRRSRATIPEIASRGRGEVPPGHFYARFRFRPTPDGQGRSSQDRYDGRNPRPRSASARADSAGGTRSTRSRRSSRSGPAGAEQPRQRPDGEPGDLGLGNRRQGQQAATAALDVQRRLPRRPGPRRHPARAPAAGGPTSASRGHEQGGAIRLGRIGGGQEHDLGAPSPGRSSRAARSRSTAPGSANCAAPRPSTK